MSGRAPFTATFAVLLSLFSLAEAGIDVEPGLAAGAVTAPGGVGVGLGPGNEPDEGVLDRVGGSAGMPERGDGATATAAERGEPGGVCSRG